MIALIEGNKETEFEGRIDGIITTERHGEGGFGYDKVFRPDGFDITFAQMGAHEKNSISHRGKATQLLIEYLNKTL